MNFMASQNRSPLYIQALEPRILYDAAGLVSGAEVADSLDTADDAGIVHSTDSDTGSGGTPNHNEDTELLDALNGLDSPGGDDPREIVFVDAGIEDYQTLIDGVSDDAEVVRIDTGGDGVSVISRVLAERSNLSAVHIVTHGDPGVLYLGSTRLSSDNLSAFENGIRGWADALTQDADILFYGCDVADGTEGRAFVDRLSDLTGADVAASVDDTGSTALGGDWDLERQTGAIETDIAFNTQSRAAFSSLLAVADEDFEGNITDTDTANNTVTLNGFVYESDTNGVVAIQNTAVGQAIGSGNYLIYNQSAANTNGGSYFEIRASDLNDNFRMNSLELQGFVGASLEFNIVGYNGGSSGTVVASDTIKIDEGDTAGSVSYAENASNFVAGGTLTFDSTWTGIDTIRFTETTNPAHITALIDNINITLDPTVTSSTYDASNGTLVVTATDLQAKSGLHNDIDVSNLTLTGEGGATYKLLDSSDVEITSATEFTVTLSAADKVGVNQILNKSGLKSTDDTTYNLAAADDWNTNVTAGDTADLTLNAIDVSNVAAPTVTSATYDVSTGQFVVTSTGLLKADGATNDIDVSDLTFTGKGGATYTLTTNSDVEIDSATQFTVTLSGADKTAVDLILDKAGTVSSSGTTYNLAAAEDWNTGADAAVNIADLFLNGITVSGIGNATPTIRTTPA